MRRLRHDRAGRLASDTPARERRHGRGRSGTLPQGRAAQGEGGNARVFRRQLQAARAGRVDLPDLAHDAGEAAVTQRFLHHRGDGTPGGDMQDAIRAQAHTGQGRGIKIGAFGRPQHRPLQPGEDACHHQPGGAGIRLAHSLIGHFMQTSQSQPATGQMPVERGQAKGQHLPRDRRAMSPLQRGDGRPQICKLLFFR